MANINWRRGALAALAGLALSACGGGEDTGSSTSGGSGTSTTPANSAPRISGAPVTNAEAGTTYEFQPTATDPDGDALTFSATGLPGWATIDAETGEVAGTPTETDAGTTGDITIQVSDQKASSRLSPFKINVKGKGNGNGNGAGTSTNSAPTIAGSPATSVQATSSYAFTPTASDPEGQALSFYVANKPSWATFNPSTGTLSGTPSSGYVGVYSNIVISASDGGLSASLPAFSISVTAAPNAAPMISGAPATAVQATMAYSFTPRASDADGDALSFSITGRPSWASFNTSTGRLSGTPSSSQVQTYSNIVISVSDGKVSTALPAFAITVTAAPNAAPTISGTPASSVVAGNAYTFTPTASDADGDMLAFSISGKPAWATFSTATGKLSGTPTTAQAGSYLNIVISVSDGKVSTVLPAFGITVSQPAPSGTATLSWTAPTQNTDGSLLTDLAGFRVYHGTSPGALDQMTQLPGAGTTSYVYNQLTAGTHYFAVAAYTASGAESELSTVGSKTIQ